MTNYNATKTAKTSQTIHRFTKYKRSIVISLFFLPCVYFGSKLYNIHKKPDNEKFNIVFDLDDTLVITNKKYRMDKTNLSNKGKYMVTSDKKYYVWPRPFVVPVLSCLSCFANLHLFTRATNDYADNVCDLIGIGQYLKIKLYREECEKGGKDLTKISNINNTDPNKSILVDNLSNNKVGDQHFYHITEFEASNKYDTELLSLLYHMLKTILAH